MPAMVACSAMLRDELLRRLPPPRLGQHVAQAGGVDLRQMHEHRRIAVVVIGSEERLRIGLEKDVAQIEADLQRDRLVVLAQADEELSTDAKRQCAVRGSLFDLRQ